METEENCLLADAYAYFQQGLYFDEDGHKADALQMYEKGVELFDQGAKSRTAKHNELYDGLVKTKQSVLPRIKELKEAKHDAPNDPMKVDGIRRSLESTCVDDAELIYWLPEGVQLTIIEKDSTCAPTPPSALAILKLGEKAARDAAAVTKAPSDASSSSSEPMHPAAMLQVGPWAYPLFPNRTAILKNELGVYIVQNPTQEQPNMFVGIILPRDLDPQLEEEFLYALNQFAVVRSSEIVDEMTPEERERISERIAAFFVKMNKIGEVGEAVGRSVADSVSTENSGGRLIRGTFTVVGGGITGASTAWIALEDASKTLFRNFADEAVQTVQVKYGDEASETTRNALYAAGHTALASFQLYELGPRSIAGHMARRAGLQFVRDYNTQGGTTDVNQSKTTTTQAPSAPAESPKKICAKPKQL